MNPNIRKGNKIREYMTICSPYTGNKFKWTKATIPFLSILGDGKTAASGISRLKD